MPRAVQEYRLLISALLCVSVCVVVECFYSKQVTFHQLEGESLV